MISPVVEVARANFARNLVPYSGGLPPLGARWEAYARRTAEDIGSFSTVEEVIHAAQSPRHGFESRRPAEYLARAADDIEECLAIDFPQFAQCIGGFADSPMSTPGSLLERSGRLVSWPVYTHARVIMRCLTHVAQTETVLEIGGGTGGPARLWLENPIRRPRRYINVDLPESLFFSEVYLRHHLGADNVAYLDAGSEQSLEKAKAARAVLVPVQHLNLIEEWPLDLVLNQLSMQEMSDGWVDFYMRWLDRSRAPRSFAEMLFTRRESPVDKAAAIPRFDDLMSRALTGQNFLELVNCVRDLESDWRAWQLVRRALSEMPFVPRELHYLASRCARKDTTAYAGSAAEIDAAVARLDAMRLGGGEAKHD